LQRHSEKDDLNRNGNYDSENIEKDSISRKRLPTFPKVGSFF
jgi:hypothetical protein